MKILLLAHDLEDSRLIRTTLETGGHQVLPIETSEQAWSQIEAATAPCLIADWDSSDVRSKKLVARIRGLKTSPPLYIILLADKVSSEDLSEAGADDILNKPIAPHLLLARVAVGERLLSLADDLANLRHQLETDAIYDPQTGLLNRNAFYRQASGELERARRASQPISLIALDIDNFTSINASYGTPAGDLVLKFVGQTIHEKSRPYDCIGRWSGDEFLIALPGVIGPDAEHIAGRILAGIHAERIRVGPAKLLEIGVSAGVVCAARINTAAELEPLIEQSRQAMARAREAGGDQVHQIYL